MDIENFENYRERESDEFLLTLINRVDLLIRVGLISDIDKTELFPDYNKLVEKYRNRVSIQLTPFFSH